MKTTKQKAALRTKLLAAWTLAHRMSAPSDVLSAIEAAIAALDAA